MNEDDQPRLLDRHGFAIDGQAIDTLELVAADR